MLTTQDHRAVQREARVARNASARARRRAHREAEAWCIALDARVIPYAYHGTLLYEVRVPGFHPATALCLEHAVAHLDQTVADWCASGAAHGPTGARLAPLCEKRRGYLRVVK